MLKILFRNLGSVMSQFWNDIITQKSFDFLLSLEKKYPFVLIGGWAVYLYTHELKSKDIDIICPFEGIAELKKDFVVQKNPRLKKYEVKLDGFDLDVYVPFYSELGVKIETVLETSIFREGFQVPRLVDLVILKLFAYHDRQGSLKGEKDKIDLLSILKNCTLDSQELQQRLHEEQKTFLWTDFKAILTRTRNVPMLGITDHHMRKIRQLHK